MNLITFEFVAILLGIIIIKVSEAFMKNTYKSENFSIYEDWLAAGIVVTFFSSLIFILTITINIAIKF